jgi:hypothetical protein
MSTPKQKRLREREKPVDHDGSPVLLDERFDEMGQADAEFSRWRWPGRDECLEFLNPILQAF